MVNKLWQGGRCTTMPHLTSCMATFYCQYCTLSLTQFGSTVSRVASWRSDWKLTVKSTFPPCKNRTSAISLPALLHRASELLTSPEMVKRPTSSANKQSLPANKQHPPGNKQPPPANKQSSTQGKPAPAKKQTAPSHKRPSWPIFMLVAIRISVPSIDLFK